MDSGVSIRLLTTLAEFQACHHVQKAAWQFPDRLIIPYTQLLTVQQHGGSVLGAFHGPNLVGFVYGYLGRRGAGPVYLFSQRMGVLPDYQGRGIGEQLKWAQRAWALEQGLDRVLWTYDPLEPPNARLNIAKLGGLVRHYERDIYGDHETPLHSQIASDRFLVEWDLGSERVVARLDAAWTLPTLDALLALSGPAVNVVTWDRQGLPITAAADLAQDRPRLAVEVPARWQDVRQASLDLAADWRSKTRTLFEHYLAQGYAVTGYASDAQAGQRRNFYFLERDA